MNKKPHTLAVNQSSGNQPVLAPSQMLIGHGACQPPKNNVTARAETVVILTYSASMNIANFSDEYSVWNPPTSSASASGRSKGAPLVSPTMAVTYTRKDGSSRKTYHLPSCAAKMPEVDMVPA